jgi:hypothetical protein
LGGCAGSNQFQVLATGRVVLQVVPDPECNIVVQHT